MQDIILSVCLQRKFWTMSSWQGAAAPPDTALTRAVPKDMVLLISQTSPIPSLLSHLGLDIYCIIARTLTERGAVPLTQQMRRSSWNVLAELLMSNKARNGGCTFLNTNTFSDKLGVPCWTGCKKMLLLKHYLTSNCHKSLTADRGMNILLNTNTQGTKEGW